MTDSRPTPYAAAVAELFALQGRGVKLGLENARALLDFVGAPDRRLRIVQVAGTNGKGSTSAFLAAGLAAAGIRVGLFTSPHLVDFRERIRVDGQPISEEEVATAWAEIQPEVDRRNATFFEANTAIALSHFARSRCEAAVLETGMGGRLDATTATHAKICVLTRIAFDHREYLGDTLEAIAREKAAILRAGTRGFSAPQVGPAADVIRTAAESTGATVTFVPEPRDVRVSAAATELAWRGRTVTLRMVGRHQAQNAVLALEALGELVPDLSLQRRIEAMEAVEVAGRFQLVEHAGRPLRLDVAHNPDALACFARALEDAYPGRERRVFLAMLRDKDLGSSVAALAEGGVSLPLLVGSAASAPEARRLRREDWERLPHALLSRGVWVGGVPEGLTVLERWQAEHPDGVAAVAGSFTSVGEAMRLLGIDTLET